MDQTSVRCSKCVTLYSTIGNTSQSSIVWVLTEQRSAHVTTFARPNTKNNTSEQNKNQTSHVTTWNIFPQKSFPVPMQKNYRYNKPFFPKGVLVLTVWWLKWCNKTPYFASLSITVFTTSPFLQLTTKGFTTSTLVTSRRQTLKMHFKPYKKTESWIPANFRDQFFS